MRKRQLVDGKRKNGKGTAMHFKDGRDKPWTARITIGKDINGKPIRYYIDSFKTEIKALACLEKYHEAPYPLYIKESSYNKIVTFPKEPYLLVPVENPNKKAEDKVKKATYTFKKLFDEFKELEFLSKEEEKLAKDYHVIPQGKFGYSYSKGLLTAFNNCKPLHDKAYIGLKASDFRKHLKESGKGLNSKRQMVNLFSKLDRYALQEDIIQKGYAQFLSIRNKKKMQIGKFRTSTQEKFLHMNKLNIYGIFLLKERLDKVNEKKKNLLEIFG